MPFKFTGRLMAAVLCLFMSSARAEIVIFEFQGKLTYSTYMAPVGTPVVGHFGWDTATPEAPPITSNSNTADYAYPATVGIWARVGPHTAISTNLIVTVSDGGDSGQDFIMVAGMTPVVDGTTYRDGALAIVMVTAPNDASVFSSLALPSKLNVNRFRWEHYGQLQSDGGQTGQIYQFSVDSVRRVPWAEGLLPHRP